MGRDEDKGMSVGRESVNKPIIWYYQGCVLEERLLVCMLPQTLSDVYGEIGQEKMRGGQGRRISVSCSYKDFVSLNITWRKDLQIVEHNHFQTFVSAEGEVEQLSSGIIPFSCTAIHLQIHRGFHICNAVQRR